jgi:hypothetical protein
MAINPVNPVTRRLLPNSYVFNYALVNLGGMYPLYSTLEKYLRDNRPPKLIMLSFLPTMLTDKSNILAGSNFTKFYAAKFYTFGEIVSDAEIRRHPVLLTQLLAEKCKVRMGYESYDIPYDKTMIERLKETRGQLLILEDTSADEAAVQQSPQFRSEFKVSPQSVRYLSMFLDLAASRGTQVILFPMPLPETALRSRLDSGYYDRYFGVLRELEATHPNLTVVEVPYSFPDEYFARDVTHLNKAGVEKFHAELWPSLLGKAGELLLAGGRAPSGEANAQLRSPSENPVHLGELPLTH